MAATSMPYSMDVDVQNKRSANEAFSDDEEDVDQSTQGAVPEDVKAKEAKQAELEKCLDPGQLNFMAALDGRLGLRIDPVVADVKEVKKDLVKIKSKQKSMSSSIQNLEKKSEAFEKRLANLEKGETTGSSGAPHASSSGGGAGSDPGAANVPKREPIGKRRVVCVGGFRLCEGEEITAFLTPLKETHPGIEKVFGVGSYTNRGKIIFQTSNDMWSFMTSMKGKKLWSNLADPNSRLNKGHTDVPNEAGEYKLWHSIDKYADELSLSYKCSFARDLVIEFLAKTLRKETTDLEKAVDAGKDGGTVVLVTKHIEGFSSKVPVKLYSKSSSANELVVAKDAQEKIKALGLDFDLSDRLGEINDPPRP